MYTLVEVSVTRTVGKPTLPYELENPVTLEEECNIVVRFLVVRFTE